MNIKVDDQSTQHQKLGILKAVTNNQMEMISNLGKQMTPSVEPTLNVQYGLLALHKIHAALDQVAILTQEFELQMAGQTLDSLIAEAHGVDLGIVPIPKEV